MPKGNIGTSLRKAPRSRKVGKDMNIYVPNGSKRPANLKRGDEVIRLSNGDIGTIVAITTISLQKHGLGKITTVQVRKADNSVTSGAMEDFQRTGSRFASHGAICPSRCPLAQGYGQSGRQLRNGGK